MLSLIYTNTIVNFELKKKNLKYIVSLFKYTLLLMLLFLYNSLEFSTHGKPSNGLVLLNGFTTLLPYHNTSKLFNHLYYNSVEINVVINKIV